MAKSRQQHAKRETMTKNNRPKPRGIKNSASAHFMLALLVLITASATISTTFSQAADVVQEEVGTCSAMGADGTCSDVPPSDGQIGHAGENEDEDGYYGADAVDDDAAAPMTTDEEREEEEEEFYYQDEEEEEQEFNCSDLDSNCPTWASKGDCETIPGYMTHYCPYSCDTCETVRAAAQDGAYAEKGTNTAPCRDDHYQCAEWAGMGECDANPGYMLHSCRRACMVCYEGTNQFGIGQRLPAKHHPEYATTKSLIDKSIQFMTNTVWTDPKYKRVRHKCRNQHEDCTYWAALGECEANPNYMKTNCAPACLTCDLLDIRNRCPMGDNNECIWKPGDLNTLFENIVDDANGKGEYLKYNAKAFSRPKFKKDGSQVEGVEKDGPWIVLLENFVTAEEADRIVEIGQKQGYERSADVGKEKPDGSHEALVSDSRTSHNTWCQEESCYKDPLVAGVIERIANVTNTEVKNSEYLQLLEYKPGQYYKQHHDYISHHIDMPCGVRILTLFIYLNDVEEGAGGGTRFPLYDVTVQPKKGNAVLWPSVLDHDPEKKDGRTDHEALPVLKGVKYGANAWIHSRDFKRAFAMNCH